MTIAIAEARAIVSTSRLAWLEARRRSIGSSDVPVLFGVQRGRFASKYSVWADKVGLVPLEDGTSEVAEWGSRLEAVIADRFVETHRERLIDHGRYTILLHPTRPYMSATLDREIATSKRGPGALEIKTVDSHIAYLWDDGVPLYVQIQIQHQLAVTGFEYGVVAALVGGNDFRTYEIERNPDFIAELEAQCELFWGMVERREAPETDASEATHQALKRAFPMDVGTEIPLPVEAADWDRELVRAKADRAAALARIEDYSNRLKAALGENERGVLPDGSGYSWKTYQTPEHVVAASIGRTLRRFEQPKPKRRSR